MPLPTPKKSTNQASFVELLKSFPARCSILKHHTKHAASATHVREGGHCTPYLLGACKQEHEFTCADCHVIHSLPQVFEAECAKAVETILSCREGRLSSEEEAKLASVIPAVKFAAITFHRYMAHVVRTVHQDYGNEQVKQNLKQGQFQWCWILNPKLFH
jgi:hypothetical protein